MQLVQLALHAFQAKMNIDGGVSLVPIGYCHLNGRRSTAVLVADRCKRNGGQKATKATQSESRKTDTEKLHVWNENDVLLRKRQIHPTTLQPLEKSHTKLDTMKKEEDRTIRDANITLPMKNTFKKLFPKEKKGKEREGGESKIK